MASPFSIFRKNQKVMLAVITLMAMFAFVFIPIIMQGIGGRAAVNPVVAKTTKFGNLHQSDLSNLRINHLKVLEVLGELKAKGDISAAVAAGKLSADGAERLYRDYAARCRREFEAILGQANPEDLVNSWLLARSAEQTGMVINDDMIKSYIKEKTQDAVPPKEIQDVLDKAGLGLRVFFSLMHDELLALRLREEFSVSVAAATPGQRWDYFNRVKRMATIEAVPVAVANCVKQVADPKEEELKTFFEENKARYPSPESPEPGFRKPHKVALEYFKADYEKFATPQTVPDAEVQEYYEKNKDKYAQILEELLKKEAAEKKVQKPAEKKDQKPTEKAGPKPAEKTPQKPVEKKDQKPAEKSQKKKDSKGVSLNAPPLPKREGTVAETSRFVLASFAEEKKANDKPPPAVKAAEPPKTTTPPVPAEKNKKAEPSKPVLPEALKSRIRQAIAREKILTIFDGLRVQMDEYGQERSRYDVERITGQSAAGGGQKPLGSPPPRLDFAKLAKQNGLATGHTGLIAKWQAEASDIGASEQVTITTDDKGERRISWGAPVAQYAYQTLSAFRSAVSLDDRALYLFWKTKDEKEHVPKFDGDGVREEVLRSWKMIHARDDAMKQAKLLAQEATKANKPLKQVFADRPEWRVVLPPKFSWMTFGNVATLEPPSFASLSSVADVEMAGEEFMRAVFALESPGQVAAAFNAPKTIVYVVRLTSFSPAFEVRKADFETTDFSKYAAVGRADQRQIHQAWLKAIQTSAGFEWTPGHDPNRPMESDEPASRGRPSEPEQPWED
jgi:hypothetical protein